MAFFEYGSKKNDVSKSDCGEPYQPLLSEFQELYSEHPNGAIGTDLGLPLTNTWWAYDKIAYANVWYDQSLLIYRMDQAPGHYQTPWHLCPVW